ncbi:MAG: chromosome segregation protein SMC [Planctomycetes bacterium]|nr:chromosome segregation protein SMC [Planctomycetota bacterium]
MRLKKVVLNGFKSFADKTEFSIDAAVTVIVGPNGCGKSNIVDGVKWVLGEQKVKSLRSDQMVDVIFSGSSSRKPLGAAEVSLVFANPEKGGTRQLSIDADEVQISRKVYRSGDSEYRINGKTCRLRDLREMLMDTGIGTMAYSIIEQGQIDKMLGATKTDRRAVFEEAAGISRYKAHKKEALGKLARTEQNLLRLADIIQEVAKSLRSVKLQAGKARNYLQYTQRLKELQVNYSLVEYSRYHAELEQRRADQSAASERFAVLAAEVSRTDALLSTLAAGIIENEHALSEAGNRLVSVQSGIEKGLQGIEFLRTRITELDERKQTQSRTVDRVQSQTKGLRDQMAQYEDEVLVGERLLGEKGGAAREIEDDLRRLEDDLAVLETDLEDEKSGIIDSVRRTAQLHNEIQSSSRFRSNLSNQKERLVSRVESARAELEAALTEKAQHSVRLDDIEKVLADLESNLEAKREQIEVLEGDMRQDREERVRQKESRSALSGELAALNEMERRYEGVTEAVRTFLKGREGEGPPAYSQGILADKLEAELEYATAVEAAMEGFADAVVVDEMSSLLADREISAHLKGRVQFVCRAVAEEHPGDENRPDQPGILGRLSDFVRSEEQFRPLVRRLLGRTLLTESVEVGLALSRTMDPSWRFVTKAGELVQAGGLLRVGPLGPSSGLISRKSRIRQLQASLDEITRTIAALEGEIHRNDQSRTHLIKLCKDLRTAIYEAHTEKMQASSHVTLFDQTAQRLKKEQPLIAHEVETLEEEINESVQKEYDSKQKLEELEAVSSERGAHVEELESEIALLRERRQMQMSELTELKVVLGQITEQSKAAQQMIAGIRAQVDGALLQAREAEAEIAAHTEQVDQASRDILSSEAEVSDLFVEKEAAQEVNRGLKETIAQLTEEQRGAEQSIHSKRAAKESIEEVLNDLRVQLGQLEVKQQDLVERIKDELQIDLEEAHETHEKQDMDWESVRDEINQLRGKIERLGNVNVDAIEEQERLEERHEFMSRQVEDLHQSKEQLEQLIHKLDKTSREKFIETFEEIRVNFQKIFRKLFGGGKADILLEAGVDVLDAGIEVVAKPPGKETRSISLLSGGEKSMTALALQFAVFKTKPTPFCFLDEVDAALDEANNERFNLLLKDFSLDTQFVIITHAKRTMSIADVLYGVTMQTQGVSKKFSVRFDDYEAEEAAVA